MNLTEGNCFLFRNLPAIVNNGRVIIYDYFNSRIADISKEDFLKNNLPNFTYDKIPNSKEFDPKKSYLTLILNKSCNMGCVYCFADGGDCNKKMSKEIIRESIKEAIKPETEEFFLTFFGGEPTLCYDEIVFAVKEAEKYPVTNKFAISTNGVMNEKMLDFLIEKRFAFNLSMDGTPEVQDKQRPMTDGSSSYKHVEHTIKKLVRSDISFKVRATITSDSLEEMPKMIKYLSDLGVKYIHLEAVNVAGRAKKKGIEKPLAKGFVKKFTECLEIAKKYNVTLVNGIYTNLNNPSIHSCSAVTGGKIIVTPEGYLSRCYEVQEKDHPYADQFIVGEFKKDLDKFEIDEEKIKNLKCKDCNSAEQCNDCFAKFICSGGCVMRNMHGADSQDIKEIDPYQCEIIKGLLEDAILRISQSSKFKIRQMNRQDLESVSPWMQELAEKSFGKVIPELLNKRVSESFKNFPEGFVVLEKDGIKGMLWFDIDKDKNSVFIHAIYLDKSLRGQGLAKKLMEYLRNYCKKNNIKKIELNVTKDLENALKFYKKEGFNIDRHHMSFNLER